MTIEDDLYDQIRRVMPIPCVDLLVSDDRGHILLVRRMNPPAKGEWWFLGGRVHHGETRKQAAVRKLWEVRGLEAQCVEEMGTFDVMLELPARDKLSHGITTLFHVRVQERGSMQLDVQSESAAWQTLEEWKDADLHVFARQGLDLLEGRLS